MVESTFLGVKVDKSYEGSSVKEMEFKIIFGHGSVLLIHIGLIILLIGSPSGKWSGFFAKMSHQVPVEELRAVITVKATQRERFVWIGISFIFILVGFNSRSMVVWKIGPRPDILYMF